MIAKKTMNLFLYFGVLLILSSACSRKMAATPSVKAGIDTSSVVVVSDEVLQKIPVCIARKIDSIKSQRVWNPPAEIYQYDYAGKNVYTISSNCCDAFTTLVDENCNYICAPSGGFTGRGDGKCPEFTTKAKQVRLVWKDERGVK